MADFSAYLLLAILGIGAVLGNPACGADNPNNNVIDINEPEHPGPFHDLTTRELHALRKFLELDPNIRASDPGNATLNSSFIYAADLLLPAKSDVLQYLDVPGNPQPDRRARVIVFRGDQVPAVVQEYACWPLPDVSQCELINFTSRRNPVEYNYRPMSNLENAAITEVILPVVDREVGFILQESYGATFTGCQDPHDCLTINIQPVGSELTKDPSKRLTWINTHYNLPYRTLHVLDFAVLVDTGSPNPQQWSVVKIWYGTSVFQSFEQLIEAYNNGTISKTKTSRPANDENLFSSMKRRGEYMPPNPQRPPTLVEPDGKRYSLKDKKVEYMGWTFHFRSSSLTGPVIYDVKYKGKRIAYEAALNELGVFYSAHEPAGQTSDFVDSGELLGSWSRALVPGADCPDSATLVPSVFMSQSKSEPDVYKASFCLFEHNNGYPLRRHLSYELSPTSFYAGMSDNVLILRSAITVENYDYMIDFIFHQNGVVEVRLMSTGYIQAVFYSKLETPYGFQIHDNLLGNVHHHLAHFKVDLDVEGTTNRYTTLDIIPHNVNLTAFPDRPYSQTRFRQNLRQSELSAVYDHDFKRPKYHVVYNDAVKTDKNEIKGYRIQMDGMSKNLVAEGEGNEKTMSWGRHQMVVTKHKDDELSSSSIYGMYDSYQPVVDFTSFYTDNETIVDEDLVFWITSGMHHIPHTEDIPVTPTVGNHLTFFLLPYNYFPECPSMGSRDAIYAEHVDRTRPELGVTVERYGNSRDQCVTPKSNLEELVADDPNIILGS